ncbi:hypothetical protein ONZ45_g9780 [Pleurotus djamor]|nr:hypothetical protein ONZ45_g9780 [Pleurotus djamor]
MQSSTKSITVLPLYSNTTTEGPSTSQRTSRLVSVLTWVGLLFLATLMSFILFATSSPQISSYHPQRPSRRPRLSLYDLEKTTEIEVPGLPFVFEPQQELAAITSFLTATSSNVLPSVDTSSPIDPELVLGFDVRRSPEELSLLEEEVWSKHPVLLYSKHYSGVSRTVKAKLNSLQLKPAHTFIDVDVRDDQSILSPILERLTGAEEFPILLIGGQVVRADSPELLLDELSHLIESGELEHMLKEAGAVVGGARKTVLRQRVQADIRKPRPKKQLTRAERFFRGLISV